MTPWTVPPTRLYRWGSSRARYFAGLTLVALGVAATNFTSTYSLLFVLIGPSLHVIGWLVLPGALWRRLLVLIPALLAGLILLGGADFTGAFAVLLACWLFVRHRPLLSYPALLAPIAVSFILKDALSSYDQNWIGYLAGTVTAVASAWLAWWLHGWAAGRRPRRAPRPRAGQPDAADQTDTAEAADISADPQQI
ncbi:hypothetical protein E3T26_08070 [Cryobacterium sp. TMT1-21]|uniref:Uncharacterized protein n=1 Tax=Cryobacterium shii TaxID=1259235 RepID=A0AAQ2HF28_9MICO|nr:MULTISPECIES: hypothetical protein [Cryobacterium]TFC43349.1 hypothetical protein E3O49_12850 [Cryobacterium shii]TFC87327.1 hypothetical protein E3T24_05415 [Cryobacterium sp. TmT2-59]TFD14674.1 hypothetical protein E3T26_08070 [Cryobacterium sp. TMT1-21]TFD17823.1 hypothetical protein E3T32_13250 [Cryobacterium sp. TMT2-23]TFD18319.1 hypothetical protein E3T42_06265 [Cryobacterium sp. TMT4-10]